jgi:hypothetical protein
MSQHTAGIRPAKIHIRRPRRCAVCRHPERARIELLRAGGASYDSLGTKFGLHRDAIWRHWRDHVSVETKAQYFAGPVQLHELAERAAVEGLSLLDYLSIVRSTLLNLFQSAAQAGDRHGASVTAGRLLQCLTEIGRLTGELGKIGTCGVTVTNNVMVLNSPAFAQLQSVILRALAPYPEARLAVVGALRQIETEPEPAAAPLTLEALSVGEDRHFVA